MYIKAKNIGDVLKNFSVTQTTIDLMAQYPKAAINGGKNRRNLKSPREQFSHNARFHLFLITLFLAVGFDRSLIDSKSSWLDKETKVLKRYGMDCDLIISCLADRRRTDNVENDLKVETSTFIIVQPVYNKNFNSRLIFFTFPVTSQKINDPLY